MEDKKTLEYDYELMKRAGALLNSITVKGVENIRAFAELANILDSGHFVEENDESIIKHKKGGPDDGPKPRESGGES